MTDAPAPPTHPERKPPPQYVPSREVVDAVAEQIAVGLTMVEDWAALPAVAKLHWRTLATNALNAAGPHLVASALEHVVSNHESFGFDARLRDELVFAQLVTALPVTEASPEDRPGPVA